MDAEQIPMLQLPLFGYGESISNVVELFPAVWQATECLTSPDSSVRLRGIDVLVELGAHHVSPLVGYMIATCLTDVDINIRRKVVGILSEMISSGSSNQITHEEVRKVVINYLHKLNEPMIFDLLEVSLTDPQADKPLYHIFNACPYAGKFLGDIVMQWKNPSIVRQKAIYFIGIVGYLEALPVLEKLLSRLEARQNGQYSMSFAPPSSKTEDDLLPGLRVAINQLNAR
jgi:hypothetical protein